MNKEKNNNMFKLVSSKLTYIGVVICFSMITAFFVVVVPEQGSESSSFNDGQEIPKKVSRQSVTTAASLTHKQTLESTTIEHPNSDSVFNKPSIVQLLSNITLEKATTERIEQAPVEDPFTFALLQNSPTLGKPSNDEFELNSILDESQVEQVENKTAIEDSASDQLEDESANEDSVTETDEEEPVNNDSESEANEGESAEMGSGGENSIPEEPIERDPALERSDIINIIQEPTFPYSENLPIPSEHQEFLYELCVQYGLEYEKVLAVMEHESKFDPNAIGATSDFGYFQINSFNHQWLSETLGTPNEPLNPYVNMQWGTFFISDLVKYWEKEGLTGTALEDAVLSSYNKGITGFKRTGKAVNYVEKVRASYELIMNEYM